MFRRASWSERLDYDHASAAAGAWECEDTRLIGSVCALGVFCGGAGGQPVTDKDDRIASGGTYIDPFSDHGCNFGEVPTNHTLRGPHGDRPEHAIGQPDPAQARTHAPDQSAMF